MNLPVNKKVYFASDNHLGAPDYTSSRERERIFLGWLNHIEKDAAVVFLLGDLFDFWFEYKTVVPKGFVRVLGKLADMVDKGIEIHYFVGNHDLWMTDYFKTELGIPVYHQPKEFTINNKRFFLGHGDGLGPGDNGYKRMKKVFTNPFFNWLFRWLHPDIGVRIAQYLSVKNKLISGDDDIHFLGEDNEWLVQYSKRKLEQAPRDFFIFGHRHLPMEIPLSQNATYFNLGDWIIHYTYAVFNGEVVTLKTWETIVKDD